MKKRMVKVKLMGKKKDCYQIKFPNVPILVEVNEDLYHRMLHSKEYNFLNHGNLASIKISA